MIFPVVHNAETAIIQICCFSFLHCSRLTETILSARKTISCCSFCCSHCCSEATVTDCFRHAVTTGVHRADVRTAVHAERLDKSVYLSDSKSGHIPTHSSVRPMSPFQRSCTVKNAPGMCGAGSILHSFLPVSNSFNLCFALTSKLIIRLYCRRIGKHFTHTREYKR